MMERRLERALQPVAARYRRLHCWTALSAAWLLAALIGFLVWSLGRLSGTGYALPVPAFLAVSAVLAGVGLMRSLRSPPSDWLARRIEVVFPELRSSLLAAIEQRPELPGGRFGYLQSTVIQDSVWHSQQHTWSSVVPRRTMAAAIVAHFGALALFIVALATLRGSSSLANASGIIPGTHSAGPIAVVVEPGNVDIERGTSLLVLARIQGALPPEARLEWQPSAGESSHLAMSLALGDPVFAARIPEVAAPLEYRVAFEGCESPSYHVTVFDYPRLDRLDARLVFPAYTQLSERLVQDVRTLSVVEGTEATLVCRLNKAVAKAEWHEGDQSPPIKLVAVDSEPAVYQAKLLCDRSRRLSLVLTDDAGRTNPQKAELTIQVVPSRPPTIRPTFPARDVEVSALEELEVKATAFDDFGLVRAGISLGLAEGVPVDVVLVENSPGREKTELAHTIRLEELRAEPDQLLSYHFWAEDVAADGSLRRTESDMYFAEVRPFDEIFRQGSSDNQRQQPGNSPPGSQNANAAQDLAKLQKEIMNATWKLIRRESGPKTTPEFPVDVDQVAQSQATARQQAERLGERAQDPQSQAHLSKALESMQTAIEWLRGAHDELSNAPLHAALTAEQSAYQSLLRMRAREQEIVRGQQSPSSGAQASSARSEQQRQQLNQLELKDDENRYETQRLARSQNDDQADRENRQVLNRLSELARRQHDLNERLKELQSALAEAKTPEQRDEIKRQLQRLQDEQQQMLRDTDELQARMENEQNLERMADERNQVEQTREEIRRASEALDEERVGQAAAAGTRAERELDSLRNEFRQRASGQFNDELRELRDEAGELERREQQLSAELSPQPEQEQQARSLRDDVNTEAVEKGLTDQRQRLSSLSEKMKQLIQEAEQTEPLLSERLYDTARQLQSSNVEGALRAAENSLKRGLVDDARNQEKVAGEGVRKLREGIEKAADSVLGDETESLRRARDELRNLSDELNGELARNKPGESGSQPARGDLERGQQPGEDPQSSNGARPTPRGDASEESPQTGREGTPEGQSPNASGQERESPTSKSSSQSPQPGQEGRQTRGGSPQPGEPSQQKEAGQLGGGQRAGRTSRRGNPNAAAGATAGTGEAGDLMEPMTSPLGGNDFVEWSDRLRDVEELVGDPELRAEAARIRDRARGLRAESRRHSAPPNWELVQSQVAGPLVELSRRVSEELLRRNSKKAIVPLDRDAVPPRYSEKTRLYYERLGSGR